MNEKEILGGEKEHQEGGENLLKVTIGRKEDEIDLQKLLGETPKSEDGVVVATAVDDEDAKREAALPKYILAEIRSLELISYYHGMASRDLVERKLKRAGDFLVRATDNRVMEFEFILSVYNNRRTHSHFTLRRDPDAEKWYMGINKKKMFKDVVSLTKYFRRKTIGNGLRLQHAKSKGKHLIPHDRCFYDPKVDLLGAGHFSSVYRGKIMTENGFVKVAYKYTKALDDILDPEKNVNANKVKKEMIAEAQVMSQLRHANITQFFGMAADVMPVIIVIEFCVGGDLGRHLDTRGERLSYNERMLYVADALAGLKYIHGLSITHRDIAARNCLISVNGFVKLSDFGMGSKLKKQEHLLISKKGAHCPARWMAPELITLKPALFSKHSDVWAMGILIYEIFANGKKPHNDLENAEVLKVVKSGKFPQIDPKAGKLVFDLTEQMFRMDASTRPTAHVLFEQMIVALISKNVLTKEMVTNLLINEIPGVRRLRLFHFDAYVPQVIAYDEHGTDLGWQDAPEDLLANAVWRSKS